MLRYLHPYLHPQTGAGRRVLTVRRPDGFTLLLAILGALGVALTLAREINYGVGLNPDAVNYISVARSLLDGNGFTEFSGSNLRGWPPLYPLLLAAASIGIFDPLTVAGPLNAGLLGLTIFVVGMYLRTRLESRLLTLWCCLAMALAWPLLYVAQFARSEMSFILFGILALMQAERLLKSGSNSALIWAGAFTALACLTRYVGGALAVTIVCALAFQSGVALPQKARRIAIYGLIALAPLVLWELGNDNHPLGFSSFRDEYRNDYSIEQMLYQLLDTISGWLFRSAPDGLFTLPNGYAVALGLVVLALLGAACVLAVRFKAKSSPALLLLAGFAAMHAGAVTVAVQLAYTEEPGFMPRLIAPAYLPILLVCTLALDRVLSYTSRQNWRWAGFVLAAALCLFLLYQGTVNARVIRLTNTGVGLPWNYNTAAWGDSAALDYLRTEVNTGTVFSNEVWPAYIHSQESVQHYPLDCNIDSILRRMSDASVDEAVYLLWLYGALPRCGRHTDYWGLDRLLAAVPVEPAVEFADGVLLRYRPETDGADARRGLRQHYAMIADGIPVAASISGFNLYLDDAMKPKWITYINDQCAPDATQAEFYLRIVPVERIYLTEAGLPHGFNGYSFKFDWDGIRIGNKCMVSARLPPYAISSIRTGQFDSNYKIIWDLEYEPGRAERLRAELAAARQARPPVIQADFEVYHSGGRMIYAKESCAPEDTAAAFFLNITPTAAADLPAGSQHGFDGRGFDFYQAGALIDGRQCVASVALPDYDIANIHTGRNDVGAIWQLEYEPGRAERLRAALAAARQAQSPLIRANFEVYHHAGQLIYAKAPCAPADTAAPFFLHIVPAAAADLPEGSRQYGFENRDFAFENARALIIDGRQCIATVPLPEYDIAAIRTGQYVPDAGRLWEAEFAPAAR